MVSQRAHPRRGHPDWLSEDSTAQDGAGEDTQLLRTTLHVLVDVRDSIEGPGTGRYLWAGVSASESAQVRRVPSVWMWYHLRPWS